MPDIEYSALKMLQERAARISPEGPTVWLVDLNPGVLEVARNAGLDQQLGPDRLLFNARAAIARYRELQAGQARASLGPSGIDRNHLAPPASK